MDHNDFIWDRVDKNPLPRGKVGETALEALERRVAWLYVIYSDKAISRRFRILAAWDDLTKAQQDELRDTNIFDRRYAWRKVVESDFADLPDGKIHGVPPRPLLVRPGPQPLAQPTYRRLTA